VSTPLGISGGPNEQEEDEEEEVVVVEEIYHYILQSCYLIFSPLTPQE